MIENCGNLLQLGTLNVTANFQYRKRLMVKIINGNYRKLLDRRSVVNGNYWTLKCAYPVLMAEDTFAKNEDKKLLDNNFEMISLRMQTQNGSNSFYCPFLFKMNKFVQLLQRNNIISE